MANKQELKALNAQLKEIISNPSTVAVISAVGKDGNLYTQVSSKLQAVSDTRLAFWELLETSQVHKNILYSLWFDKTVVLTLIAPDGTNYVVNLKPYQALIAGQDFESYYNQALEEFGEDTDLSTIWYLDVLSYTEESYQVARKREREEHPYLTHFDHIVKKA